MYLELFKINNSLRHGKAQNTNLNIDVEQNIFSLNYFDDGIGFNLEEIKHKKGIGMKNIESRVALLQGNLSVKSAINQGFSIKITI